MTKNLLILTVKKHLLFLFIFCFVLGFSQSADFNSAYVVLNNNGVANKFYKLKNNTADLTNPNFNGSDLGSFNAGSTLLLQGAEHNVFKCGSCDLTATKINYRVYKTGTTPGSFSTMNIGFSSGGGNGCGGQNQQWRDIGGSNNLLSGLSSGGNYTVEVYSDATITCGSGTAYDSNGGSNYKATFTYCGPTTGALPAGNYSIPGCFATVNAAVTYINANGITGTGGVQFDVAAGYTETAPVGGFSITATGTATNPIKFVKSGSGSNPTFTANATLVSGSITDALFKIIGGDYITIDGFTLLENPSNGTVTAASNNMTEWGVALLYATTTNGAQNNTIQNCTISLNKTYTNTFGIYSNTRHSATVVTTTAEVTSAAGANSNNKIYANNISNVNYGIFFTGAGSTLSAIDTGNDIGGTSSATGNTISNLGGVLAASLYVSLSSTSYGGITMNQQINDNVSYNSITTGTVTSPITVNGILKFYSIASPTTGTITSNINNNTVSITNNSTVTVPGNGFSIVGINSQSLATLSTATFNVNNNIIQNSILGGSVSTTSNLAGFYLASAPGILNVTGNTITGNSNTATTVTTGKLYGFYFDTGGNATTTNLTGNTISNNSINPSTTTATSASVIGIYNAAAMGTANFNNNIIAGNSTKGSSAILKGIENTAAATSLNINGNTITGFSTSGASASVQGIVNSGAVTNATSISSNFLGTSVNGFYSSSVATSGTLYVIYNTGGSSASSLTISSNDIRGVVYGVNSTAEQDYIFNSATTLSSIISNNTFTNLSVATSGTIYLINNNSTNSANGTKTVQNNSVVTAFVRTGSVNNTTSFYGYYDNGSSPSTVTNTISGNNFSNITPNVNSSSTGSFYGIYENNWANISNPPQKNITNNTISNITFSGTSSAAFYGININAIGGTLATPNVISGNTVSGLASTSPSINQVGIYLGSSVLYANVFSNNIINNNANGSLGNFSGIQTTGNTNNVRIYTNTITGNSSTSTSNILGVYITGGTKVDVYQNKINSFTTSGNIWGIYVAAATTVNIYDHKNSGTNYSIFGLSSSGASATVEGIRIAAGTTVTAYQNDINNITATGTTAPIVNGIDISGGTTINIYKNKIYNISATGSITTSLVNLVNGISVTGGSTNIYNNTIGAITASAMSNPNAVNGIYLGSVASTSHKIYFNTIYLNSSSSGANFGTSGIYHIYNTTSTTSNLDLRNNIIVNKSTPKGSGRSVVFQRSASTNLNNYATTSNNNIFYAGTASANNLIYYDGTNSDQTISAFQSRVSTRENLSNTEDVLFQSTVPTDANYLRIADGTTTFAESGGAATASPVVSDDFWGTSRTTYDIGASEFVGLKKSPTITSVSPDPVCVGGTLTIIGTNFNNATAANVKIGGTAISSITSNDGSTMVVVVGSGTTGTVAVTTNLGTGTSSSPITISAPPTVTWAASTVAACQNSSAQTTTLNYTASTNSPVSYSITWNASPVNSFVVITDQANVFASGAGSININIPAGTATGTYTGNITVKNANGCVSSVATPFTLTVNNTPTDVTLTSTISPLSADACSLDYVKLEASGGISNTDITSGAGTNTSAGNTTAAGLGPNPLQNYYGGTKQQWIYRASELTALGLSTGSKIKSIKLNLVTADTSYALLNLKIKMKNSATTNFAGTVGVSSWESGLTTVKTTATYTPAVGLNNFVLDTPFVWDGTSSIVIEMNYSNNNTGSSGSFNTAKFSTTSFVSTLFYREDDLTSTVLDAYNGTASFVYSSRNDIVFSLEAQKITWTPTAGLYTNAALTTPYVAGTHTMTVYAAPTTATTYTAKATLGTCDKTSVSSPIVRNKEEYVGVGTDWNTASNWFPAVVPDNTKCAVVPAGKTIVININNAEAKSLTIAETGKVSIAANSSLKVVDAINIPVNNSANDNLVLESNAALLQDNASPGNVGNIIVKRGTHMRKSDYTYWGSPVTGQKLLNTAGGTTSATYTTGGFSEGTPNNRIYRYNEPDDTFKAATDPEFVSAKGYAIRGKDSYFINDPNPVADEFKFTGTPNNGNYFFDVKKSKNTISGGVTYDHGYNMIANPYPSHIDFIKFYNLSNNTGKNSDVIFGKAWFWTNVPGAPTTQNGSSYTPNNYAILSLAGGTPATGVDVTETTGSPIPNEFIKVAQGFIVQMRGTPPTGTDPALSGTLKFDNSIRTNNTTGNFYNSKITENEINRYWVKLISPYNIVNTILVAHMDGATNSYDPDYDADLLSLGDDSFYSKLNTQKLQIQARNNPLNTEDVISLGTKYSTNGTYKIALGDREGIFESGQKIYLKDKLTGNLTDLTNQDYIFTVYKGTDETRFEIVYKSVEVLASDELKKSDFLVYRDGEYFVIKSSNNLENVEIYDAGGKLLVSKSTSQKEIRFNANMLPTGVYIIKAQNSENVKTKKIIK